MAVPRVDVKMLRRLLDRHSGVAEARVDLAVWLELTPPARQDGAGRKYMGNIPVYAWTAAERRLLPAHVQVELKDARGFRWYDYESSEPDVWERLLAGGPEVA